MQGANEALAGGNTQQAIALLREAVRENPSVGNSLQLGSILSRDAGTANEAVSILRSVARHLNFGDARLALAKRDLGLAQLSLGNRDAARTELGKMVDNINGYLAAAKNSQTYNRFLHAQKWFQQNFNSAIQVLQGLGAIAP